jgi:hypothetical protein
VIAIFPCWCEAEVAGSGNAAIRFTFADLLSPQLEGTPM